jgi:hypothetical protein
MSKNSRNFPHRSPFGRKKAGEEIKYMPSLVGFMLIEYDTPKGVIIVD